MTIRPSNSLHISRATIGRFPLLTADAIDRLLSGKDFDLSRRKELHQVLELVIEMAMHASFGTRVSATDLKNVRDGLANLSKFRSVLDSLQDADFPPPDAPKDFTWLLALQRWIQTEEEGHKDGRPAGQWITTTYSLLLGFYELAFQSPAVSTMDGRTATFLQSVHHEVGALLAQATFDSKSEARRLRHLWAEPTPEALQKRILASLRLKRAGRRSLMSMPGLFLEQIVADGGRRKGKNASKN